MNQARVTEYFALFVGLIYKIGEDMNNVYRIKAYKQRQKAVRAEIIITVIAFAVMAVVGYNAIFCGCKWLCSIV